MIRAQRGLSLIEVLVALVVFSIGLLGVASLQAYSLKVNNVAETRTRATILANYIVERMRINDDNLSGYEIGFDDCVAAVSDSTSGGGTPSALTDKREWCQRIARELPEASGKIEYASGVALITIRWQEENRYADATEADGTTDSKQELVVRARLTNA